MSRMIVKFGDKYCEWSTVVDAPVTYLMSKDDFTTFYQEEYGLAGLRDLPARMERVEIQGTSSFLGMTAQDLLVSNRAGEEEACLETEAEMIERFTNKETIL